MARLASQLAEYTAPDAEKLGICDEIVKEPVGGAHRDWEGAAGHVRAAIREQLRDLMRSVMVRNTRALAALRMPRRQASKRGTSSCCRRGSSARW